MCAIRASQGVMSWPSVCTVVLEDDLDGGVGRRDRDVRPRRLRTTRSTSRPRTTCRAARRPGQVRRRRPAYRRPWPPRARARGRGGATNAAAVREWARANGYDVSDRGQRAGGRQGRLRRRSLTSSTATRISEVRPRRLSSPNPGFRQAQPAGSVRLRRNAAGTSLFCIGLYTVSRSTHPLRRIGTNPTRDGHVTAISR